MYGEETLSRGHRLRRQLHGRSCNVLHTAVVLLPLVLGFRVQGLGLGFRVCKESAQQSLGAGGWLRPVAKGASDERAP